MVTSKARTGSLPRAGSSALSRAGRGALDRPVLVTALIGVAFVAFQWWWIWQARRFGGFDVDEGAAVARSLGFHRALANGPIELARSTLGTSSGPVVPLLSVPFVVVFGRGPVTPMLVQPVLVAVSAVGAAGVTARLASRGAGLCAGVAVLAMPALITSSRTNQFSTGVGAFMILAIWSLLASDRGRRTWPMVAWGAACGAMTLSRTMAISFLPAMAGASLVVLALGDRRVRRNLVGAVAGAVVVAGPWWLVQWPNVLTYLSGHGYGDRASFYGEAGLGARLESHVGYLVRDFRLFVPFGLAVVVFGAIAAARSLAATPARRRWVAEHRDHLAVWVAVLGGTAALLSSANRGFWFATPIDILIVVGVVAVGDLLLRSSSRPRGLEVAVGGVLVLLVVTWSTAMVGIGASGALVVLAFSVAVVVSGGRLRRPIAGALVLVLAVVTVAASAPLRGPSDHFEATGSLRAQAIGSLERYQHTVFEGDTRFISADQGERDRAAAEWASAAHEVVRRLSEIQDDQHAAGAGNISVVVAGGRPLMEANTIAVAQELGPRGVGWMDTPNTLEPSDEQLLQFLEPWAAPLVPRVVVSIEGRSEPFPDGKGWRRLVQLARGEGWRITYLVPLPDGGRVAIYTHPDNRPPQ